MQNAAYLISDLNPNCTPCKQLLDGGIFVRQFLFENLIDFELFF